MTAKELEAIKIRLNEIDSSVDALGTCPLLFSEVRDIIKRLEKARRHLRRKKIGLYLV